MADRSNAYLRRALLERLGSIGLCPDLRNDDEAVQAVCEQTGFSRNVVVEELSWMRTQNVTGVLSRFGVGSLPKQALASVAASRGILQRQRLVDIRQRGHAFFDAYRTHANRTTQELIADLEINPLSFQPEQTEREKMLDRDEDRVRVAYEMHERPGFERPGKEIY